MLGLGLKVQGLCVALYGWIHSERCPHHAMRCVLRVYCNETKPFSNDGLTAILEIQHIRIHSDYQALGIARPHKIYGWADFLS